MDYEWIRKWGRFLGSYKYYIDDEVARARADHAPQNAIYKHDGKWYTTDSIISQTTRIALGLPLLEGDALEAARTALLNARSAK